MSSKGIEVKEHINDSLGGSGWVFKKVFYSIDNKEAKLRFVILRENNRICVTAISLWE